jgi:hypothetical protein
MEQKDYLLREIEKIGSLLKLIFNKIAGKEANQAKTAENQPEEIKGLLLREIGFDLDLFLSMNETEIGPYLSGFKGLNVSNIELLADIIKAMGMDAASVTSERYLQLALSLYALCNSLDKTFSFDRENKINVLKKTLFKR